MHPAEKMSATIYTSSYTDGQTTVWWQ